MAIIRSLIKEYPISIYFGLTLAISWTGALAAVGRDSFPPPPDSGLKNRFFSSLLVLWPLSSLFRGLIGMVMRFYPAIYASRVGTGGVSTVGMFGEGTAAGVLRRCHIQWG